MYFPVYFVPSILSTCVSFSALNTHKKRSSPECPLVTEWSAVGFIRLVLNRNLRVPNDTSHNEVDSIGMMWQYDEFGEIYFQCSKHKTPINSIIGKVGFRNTELSSRVTQHDC